MSAEARFESASSLMVPTVLGKRSREAKAASVSPQWNLPSKRRACDTSVNDENEDPFLVIPSLDLHARGLQSSQPNGSTITRSPVERRPSISKHIKFSTSIRLGLSPNKINAHFKTTKLNQEDDVQSKTPAGLQTPRTPQTPRHGDALSKKTPVTPRHRVTAVSRPGTPRTPRTPSSLFSSIPTIYNAPRQMFIRSAAPTRLIGRDEERDELMNFVRARIVSQEGGCMYVSGPPGTGKSALVSEVCGSFVEDSRVKCAYVNCMSIRTTADIYSKLVDDLGRDLRSTDVDDTTLLRRLLVPDKELPYVHLITLDEVDHLLTLDLEVLYSLFEWALQRSSRLILIGIANALDLTDRFLPRLKARSLKPSLLPFLPYTAPQITSVITTRLQSLMPPDSPNSASYVPFIHPAAIQLCSRKVASQTGDLRKAFDICKRAIDLIESETRQKHGQSLHAHSIPISPSKTALSENMNLSSPTSTHRSNSVSPLTTPSQLSISNSLASLKVETAPRATIAHMARISSAAFDHGVNHRLRNLNLQQKAALCALVASEKHKRAAIADPLATPSKTDRSAPTVQALYEIYSSLCKRDGMLHPLTATEFRDVIGSLETLSLINTMDGKKSSLFGQATPSKRGRGRPFADGRADERRVGSCVAEKELAQAVQGICGGLLQDMLRGELAEANDGVSKRLFGP